MNETNMNDAALVLRAILLLGFCFAGVAKLRKPEQTRRMLVDFGVPVRMVGIGSLILPLLEITTAVGLAVSGLIGGWLALALLFVFIIAIQASLSQGRRPDCHCFGQLKATPIGRPILARNAVLAAAAAMVIWASVHPSASSTATMLDGTTPVERGVLMLAVAQTAVIAVLSVLGWQLVKQQGRMLIRIDQLEQNADGAAPDDRSPQPLRIGVPEGAPAPDFELANLDGSTVSLTQLLTPGIALLLVFSSPHCGPCRQLLPELANWSEQLRGKLTIVILSEGSTSDHRGYPCRERVLLQQGREIAERYQAWGTPSAVLIRADGSVGSGVAAGAEQISGLVESMGRRTQPSNSIRLDAGPNATRRPDLALSLELPDLEGVRRRILQGRTGETLLLFWNTECGFCQRMTSRLKHWTETRTDTDPDLVLVANGNLIELRSMELAAPVFVDDRFELGTAYGARGSPMAVMVDEQGRAVSGVVAGEDAIFSLLDTERSTGAQPWKNPQAVTG
jgi:thiol-disulfide isomerase/thioredoxin/UPF0716 family protein affecting phage T7 exclusion